MATTTPFATNPQLTAIALAYMNQPSDYVADHVMPRVKAIGKKEFQYSIYGLESFAAPDSRVGRKGRPNEVSLSSSLATAAKTTAWKTPSRRMTSTRAARTAGTLPVNPRSICSPWSNWTANCAWRASCRTKTTTPRPV